MPLCSLSITYAWPYHNPTATMGHSIHNIDISKPLTHTTPYTRSPICPVQWKPGFIREENTSPKCHMPSNVSICPLKSVTTTNCSQVETPMRTMSMQMSFPETVSDSLCRNSLVIAYATLSLLLAKKIYSSYKMYEGLDIIFPDRDGNYFIYTSWKFGSSLLCKLPLYIINVSLFICVWNRG